MSLSDRLADVVVSLGVLVTVVVLGLADVVDAEVVTLAIGLVMPSPVVAGTARVRRQLDARRSP